MKKIVMQLSVSCFVIMLAVVVLGVSKIYEIDKYATPAAVWYLAGLYTSKLYDWVTK